MRITLNNLQPILILTFLIGISQAAPALAKEIGIDDLSDGHWKVIRFLREDFAQEGTTATLRRVSTMAGVPTKELYQLFPKKPAKKMSYVSGLQKPVGCV